MLPQIWVGETIGGRYKIDSLLGQGGMSAVYRATDPNLRRMVAIKLIHTHLSVDPNFVNRFKEEAAAVARLRHPNIVQVHDFNVDGETYYMVMEYLIGETLQARLKRLNSEHRYMPHPEVIDYCTQLCQAIGYAHNHELIHRDIKPANIMLDVNGQAILMDFGIVKIIGGEYHTATGATIGTAMYMSPEQIRSERADERSDIYSLGVTMYEMLSGRAPYRADSAMTLMMMVLNDPLPDLRKIRQGTPESLVAIVEMAMAKEQKDRFQSMEEMASALQTASDQVASFAAVATVVDEEHIDEAVSADQTDQDQVETWVDSTELESIETSTQEELEFEVPELEPPREAEMDSPVPAVQDMPGEQVSAPQQEVPPETRETNRLNYRLFILIASVLLLLVVTVAVGSYYISLQRAPEIQLASIDQPLVPISDQMAQNVVNLGRWESNSFITELDYSPEGETLATAQNRDWERFSKYRFFGGIWEVAGGNLQNYLLGHNQWLNGVAFSPDGGLLATASDDEKVLLWNVSDGILEGEIAASFGAIAAVDFSPNNSLLAAGSSGSDVGLWQLSDNNLLRTLRGHIDSVNDVQFSPDGQLLASASDDQTIKLWQVSDGSTINTLRGHIEPIHNLAFSPDGSLLASASNDSTIGIWQVSDGSPVTFLQGHSEPVRDVAFSPDGSLLASGSADGTLRLWRVTDGELVHILTDDSEGITSIAFSPDGHLLVSAASDGVIRFWGLSEALPLETEAPVISATSTPAAATSPPQAITPTSRPTNPAPDPAVVEEPGLVLWDLSHGPRQSDTGESYDLDGMFSQLDILLGENEITLIPNLDPLDQVDLDSFAMIVIAMPSAIRQNYSPEEAQLIGEFVNRGGSLLILAETPGFTNRIHELEAYLKIDVGQNMISDSPLLLGDHPVFEDVDQVNFNFSGGSLNVRDDRAQVIASQDGMDAIVVIEDLPGKVVIIGDSNLLDNRGLADNQRFALNLFRWLQ